MKPNSPEETRPYFVTDLKNLEELTEFFNSWNKEISNSNTEILKSKGYESIKVLNDVLNRNGKKCPEAPVELDQILEGLKFFTLRLPFEIFFIKFNCEDFDLELQVEKQNDFFIMAKFTKVSFMKFPFDNLEFLIDTKAYPVYDKFFYVMSYMSLKSEIKNQLDYQKITELFKVALDLIVYTSFFYKLCLDKQVEPVEKTVNPKPSNTKASKKNKKRKTQSTRTIIVPKVVIRKNNHYSKKHSEMFHVQTEGKKSFHYVKTEWEREGCWCENKNGTKYFRRGGKCKRRATSKNIQVKLKPENVKK